MGADRIFGDHGRPTPRKRRRRLVDGIPPELRRWGRKEAKRIPEYAAIAENLGIRADEEAVLYVVMLHFLEMTPEERYQQAHAIFPDWSDERIALEIAGLERAFRKESGITTTP